jgi:Ser/Thr protein kinase RdoA (MazF antagonist)
MAGNQPAGFLPVTRSVIQPRAILRLLREHFGLGDSATAILIKSMNNDVYRVESAPRGGEGSIFKVYRRGSRKPADLHWESDLMSHLEASGVGAPIIFRTTAGEPFIPLNAPEGVRLGVLYQELPGRRPGLADGTKVPRAVGELTARMYNSTGDFTSAHSARTLDFGRLIRQSRALITSLLEPAQREPMLELLDEAELRLARLIESGLDWGVCHGDLALHNVRVRQGGSILLLDFENAGYGWRAADLSAIRYELRNIDGGWDAFTEGFRENRPLGEAELTAINWMIVPFVFDSLRGALKTMNGFTDRRDEHVAWTLRNLRQLLDSGLLAR